MAILTIAAALRFAAYLLVLYVLSVIVYRKTLHPLRKYPGPTLASLTELYGGYYALKRCLHLVVYQNHQKYGPVYRQGPNRLIFNTVTALHDILRNPLVNKSDVYVLTRQTPKGNVWDTVELKEHRRKRRIVSLPLTEKSMRTFEPVVYGFVDQYIQQLQAAGSNPVNISKYSINLMGDIIGQLSFGYPLQLLSKQDNRWLLPGLNLVSWRINAYMQLGVLKKLDPFFRIVSQKVRAKYLGIITAMIKHRTGMEKDAKHDLYSFAVDHMGGGHGLGDSELWAEAFFFIIAGGTTPATTLSAMFWYLSHSPESYKKLAEEIRYIFHTLDEIKAGDKLRQCEYLRACINETLRIATPNTGILWREQLKVDENGNKPEKPLVVGGHVIPDGTLLGVNLYALHHNEEYFPEPFMFKPERWLGAETEETILMNRAFAPFSIGGRSCPGKALAYLEISVAIAKTLWQFDFKTPSGPLGRIGGGEPGKTDGRGRPGEYQQYDTFSSVHDGPYLVFTDRFR